MALSACPIALVHAPVERVWNLLSEPANYDLWWDSQTRAIHPPGSAHPGQRIDAQTKALGRQWNVQATIEHIDHGRHTLDLMTRVPFGTTVYTRITCVPLDATSCRVSFG